ncbi:MAG: hypothetical protein HKM24_02330 [Gammaproteobacteria bacterium]|nr:hypothetical protein [Gammaproteobacteria bacterium]
MNQTNDNIKQISLELILLGVAATLVAIQYIVDLWVWKQPTDLDGIISAASRRSLDVETYLIVVLTTLVALLLFKTAYGLIKGHDWGRRTAITTYKILAFASIAIYLMAVFTGQWQRPIFLLSILLLAFSVSIHFVQRAQSLSKDAVKQRFHSGHEDEELLM